MPLKTASRIATIVKESTVPSTPVSIKPTSLLDMINPEDGFLAVDIDDGNKLKKFNASSNSWVDMEGSDIVAARAVQSTGQVIPHNSDTVVTWNSSKTYDTHDALNTSTGTFTAPVSGYYSIHAGIGMVADRMSFTVGSTSNVNLEIKILVNNVAKLFSVGTHDDLQIGSTFKNRTAKINDSVFLNKDDTLKLQIKQLADRTTGTNGAYGILTQPTSFPIINNALYNYLSIVKIGE